MSHAYPLARTAVDALDAADHAARTRHEAERLAGEGVQIVSLETEWLTVAAADAERLMLQADSGVGDGFVQRYEDASGAPVLAVTYWKTAPQSKPAKQQGSARKVVAAKPSEDHTDDLYFRSGRTKARRRKRKVDPRQMDLFGDPASGEDLPD